MEPHLPETTVEKMLIQSAASKGRPITATLELTPLCNLRCDMCYIRLDPQQVRCRGGLHPVADWLVLARRMADAGVLFVLLTGGEPLLFPGFRELYLELRRLGMVVTVNTNGTLLDQDWADFFAAHPPRRVNITLYGGSDAAYAALCHAAGGFQKAIRAISLLKDRGVAVKINSSAAKANRDDLESIYRIGRELDVPVHLDSYMLPGLRDRLAPFEEQSRLNPGDAARAELLMLRRETPPDQFHGWICQTLAALDCANPDYPRQSTCQAGRSSFAVGWTEPCGPASDFWSPAPMCSGRILSLPGLPPPIRLRSCAFMRTAGAAVCGPCAKPALPQPTGKRGAMMPCRTISVAMPGPVHSFFKRKIPMNRLFRIGYCLFRLWTHDITYGTMTLFLQQRSNLSSAFNNVISIIPSFLNSSISAHRIRELVELPREVHIPESAELDALAQNGFTVQMQDLSFAYVEGTNVITDSRFVARPGEIVALIGPSGEGKTTMIRLILGLVCPQSGRALIRAADGTEVTMNAETRHLFAYVPQGNTILSGTIAENMRTVKEDATDEEIIEALKIACAWDFVAKMPDTINAKATINARSFLILLFLNFFIPFPLSYVCINVYCISYYFTSVYIPFS